MEIRAMDEYSSRVGCWVWFSSDSMPVSTPLLRDSFVDLGDQASLVNPKFADPSKLVVRTRIQGFFEYSVRVELPILRTFAVEITVHKS